MRFLSWSRFEMSLLCAWNRSQHLKNTQLSIASSVCHSNVICKKFFIDCLWQNWSYIQDDTLITSYVFLCTYLSGALDSVILLAWWVTNTEYQFFIPYVFVIWLRKLIPLGRVMYKQARCKGDVNTITSPYQLKKMAKVWGRVWNQNTLM